MFFVRYNLVVTLCSAVPDDCY